MTTASSVQPLPFRENRFFQWICLGIFIAFTLAAYHPDAEFDWALENGLVFLVVPTIIFVYRRFAFSDLSYLLLFVFLCLHEWGAHYKYSDVPLGEWMKPWLHTKRNDFDKVAHFSFGLFVAYPIREIAMRQLRVKGRWLYYLPVEFTLAVSAVYEILEALMANILTPERGEEFVGMQGDIWDSQEDMFSAFLGALTAVLIIAAVVKRRTRRAEQRQAALYAVSSK